jgi:hypothetical protein
MTTHLHGALNCNPVELETVFEPSSQYCTTVLVARKLQKSCKSVQQLNIIVKVVLPKICSQSR